MTSSSYPIPQVRVLTDFIPGERVRDVVLSASFCLAIAASAQVAFYLPGNPVPVTAQTFVVLAGAVALGGKRAVVGAALYAGLGVAGLPFFAASGGATLGYILGFVVASAMLGAWASRGGIRSLRAVTVAMILGNAVILGLGATWLGLFTGNGAAYAIASGVVPFLPGAVVKTAAAVAVVPGLWRLLGDRRDG